MKNYKYSIAILFLFICGNVFSQSDSLFHRSLGHRYNTFSIEYQVRGTGEYPIYYFYGFDDYSEAIIWDNEGDYPHWVSKRFWTLQIGSKNGNQFTTFGGGYPDAEANNWKPYYEYQLQNNNLVNFNIIYYNDLRNYMYVRHNYAFRSNTWINFFTNYYKPNYNGTRTNDEVMAIMSEYEKSILNLIIENENQK